MGGSSKTSSKTEQLPKGDLERQMEALMAGNAQNLYGEGGSMSNLINQLYGSFINGGGLDALNNAYSAQSDWIGRNQNKIDDYMNQMESLSQGNVNQNFLDNYNGYMENQVKNAQGKMLNDLAGRGLTVNSTFSNVAQNDIQRNVADQSSKNWAEAWGMQNKGINDAFTMAQGAQQWMSNALDNLYAPIGALNDLQNNMFNNLALTDNAVKEQFQTTQTTKSCFQAGTEILMADDSRKAIEEIELGDWVLGINSLGELEEKEVIFIKEPNVPESYMIKITTDRGEIISTIDQEYFRNGEEIIASKLNVGDYLTIITPASYKARALILDIKKLDIKPITYHFDVTGFNFFFADGFAVAGLN